MPNPPRQVGRLGCNSNSKEMLSLYTCFHLSMAELAARAYSVTLYLPTLLYNLPMLLHDRRRISSMLGNTVVGHVL